MHMLVDSELFTQKEKLVVNRCRLFLQVLTLSDISNRDGANVSTCYYYGRRDDHRVSTYSWPEQHNPSKVEWKIWQRCIDSVWAPLPNQGFEH